MLLASLIPSPYKHIVDLSNTTLRARLHPETRTSLGLLDSPFRNGTSDVLLCPFSLLSEEELVSPLQELNALNPLFPTNSLVSPPAPLHLHTMPYGSVLNSHISLLSSLGVSPSLAKHLAQNISLATANFLSKQDNDYINSIISLSREVGFPISADIPLEALRKPSDSLRLCSLCSLSFPHLYRIFSNDGPAATMIISTQTRRALDRPSLTNHNTTTAQPTLALVARETMRVARSARWA